MRRCAKTSQEGSGEKKAGEGAKVKTCLKHAFFGRGGEPGGHGGKLCGKFENNENRV